MDPNVNSVVRVLSPRDSNLRPLFPKSTPLATVLGTTRNLYYYFDPSVNFVVRVVNPKDSNPGYLVPKLTSLANWQEMTKK
ncbi:hypothetical protein MKS88_001468 [Plasmodium brasilianum]|uniref:Uncharacterized protein n=1 Tax=Plasmodium brasilianum TaxID=5824 RepID=A0ACB9YCS2_PLABR|nr:hypothetical protein MKS88_001468 [Plasmodium brasilianum]